MKKQISLLKQKLFLLMLLISSGVIAQETTNTDEASNKPAKKEVRSTFESGVVLNNQTMQ